MQSFHPIACCPIRNILNRLSSKWAMLILVTLHANGTMRFNDVQKSIGDISQRMLAVTLRTLEEDGLVSRKVYPEVPPRVEYRLTERGISLIPHLKSLINWAITNSDTIQKERTNKIEPKE